jgi:hypothetical protein
MGSYKIYILIILRKSDRTGIKGNGGIGVIGIYFAFPLPHPVFAILMTAGLCKIIAKGAQSQLVNIYEYLAEINVFVVH